MSGRRAIQHSLRTENTDGKSDRMTPDRRRRRRFSASWHVRLLGKGRATVDACTLNLGSGGFYCRSPEAFSPGDNLTALVDLPSIIADRDAGVVLRCDARVLRLETLAAENGWGIACRIEDYSLLRPTNSNAGSGFTEAQHGVG